MPDPYLESTLRELRIGDEVTYTRTMRVENTDNPLRFGSVVVLRDVEDPWPSGKISVFYNGREGRGSLSIAIIKRVKREYKEGDVLTGEEVANWAAPYGTTIVSTIDNNVVYICSAGHHFTHRQWRGSIHGANSGEFASHLPNYRIIHLPDN